MNKRLTKVGIGFIIVGTVHAIAIWSHYGCHWESQSRGESIHNILSGLTLGIGVSILIIQYLEGGKKEK